MAIRPVPWPSVLHNAQEAMGNSANSVWMATNFILPAAKTLQNIFPFCQVAGSSKPFQRFCLHCQQRPLGQLDHVHTRHNSSHP
jgi:hypothetical protein